jgi:hypothetical protein
VSELIVRLVGGAALVAAACSSTTPQPHGAPVLIGVYWSVGGSRYLAWSPDATDPALVAPVPPYVSEIDFVFNRRLDGSRIEDQVTVDGVTMSLTKTPPPITVDLPQAGAGAATTLEVLYNSLAVYGDMSSYAFARPHPAGLPSRTAVTFHLDRASFTSPYDEPLATPDSLSITTGDFTLQLLAPAGDGGAAAVGIDFQLPASFSNRPADVATLAPFVHARAGGRDLPVALLVDARAPTLLYVAPASCLGAWPGSSTIDVTVDPGLPDAFGVTLAGGVTASFTTGASPRPPTDTCAGADGGAGDASDGGT